MMSRKDYKLMAEYVRPSLLTAEDSRSGDAVGATLTEFGRKAQVMTVRQLARALKLDNPSFDASRFYEACGITEADLEGGA